MDPAKPKLKCGDKIVYFEHELNTIKNAVAEFLKQTTQGKGMREGKENQRQQVKLLFAKDRTPIINAANLQRPNVRKPPIGRALTSNGTSDPCHRCQSDDMLEGEGLHCPVTLQDHVNHMIQSRNDLNELVAFCFEYAANNAKRVDSTSSQAVRSQASHAEYRRSTTVNTQDATSMLRLLQPVVIRKPQLQILEHYQSRRSAWKVANEFYNGRVNNDLSFNQRQQLWWTQLKSYQEQNWIYAEMKPRHAMKMRSRSYELPIPQNEKMKEFGCEVRKIDYMIGRSLARHKRAAQLSSECVEGTATELLTCILPDCFSYATLRKVAMRGGLLFNSAQMAMARRTFKPRLEKLVKGSSGLRKEYRPHNQGREPSAMDFDDSMELCSSLIGCGD